MASNVRLRPQGVEVGTADGPRRATPRHQIPLRVLRTLPLALELRQEAAHGLGGRVDHARQVSAPQRERHEPTVAEWRPVLRREPLEEAQHALLDRAACELVDAARVAPRLAHEAPEQGAVEGRVRRHQLHERAALEDEQVRASAARRRWRPKGARRRPTASGMMHEARMTSSTRATLRCATPTVRTVLTAPRTSRHSPTGTCPCSAARSPAATRR